MGWWRWRHEMYRPQEVFVDASQPRLKMDMLVGLGQRSAVDPGSTPGRSTILFEFAEKLAASQVDLDPEFAKVIDDNFWELI